MNDEARLLSAVEEIWGLRVRGVREMRGGEAASAYLLESGSDRYFLKVYDDGSRMGSQASGRLNRVLPLMRALAERVICPAPVEVRDGRLFVMWEDRTLVLFEWIEGVSLDPMRPLAPTVRRSLARTIARVHSITAEIPFSDREDFHVPFRVDLCECLDDPGRLAALLEPRAVEIREVLDRLDELGHRFRSEEHPRVLTHGDLHGGNLIVLDDAISVVDWDDALLAGVCLGVRGAIGSTYNFAAPLYSQIFDAFDNDNFVAARACQAKSVAMVGVLNGFGSYLSAAKAAMAFVGIDCGPPRLPLPPLSETAKERLHSELEQVGLFDLLQVA